MPESISENTRELLETSSLKAEADDKHFQPRQRHPESQGKNSLLTPCFLSHEACKCSPVGCHTALCFQPRCLWFVRPATEGQSNAPDPEDKSPQAGKTHKHTRASDLTHSMVLRLLVKAGSPQSLETKSFLIIPK